MAAEALRNAGCRGFLVMFYLLMNVPSGCSSCHRCSASEPGFVIRAILSIMGMAMEARHIFVGYKVQVSQHVALILVAGYLLCILDTTQHEVSRTATLGVNMKSHALLIGLDGTIDNSKLSRP